MDIEMPNNPDKRDLSEEAFPVQVHFYDLSKMYMKMIRWNWHPEVEVVIVNHGDVCFMTHDESITLTAGEGIIINSNVMHCLKSLSLDVNCSMYSTTFSTSYLFDESQSILVSKYIDPVTASGTFQYMTLSEDNEKESRMIDCINSIIAGNMVKNFGYEISAKAKLCEFWLMLLDTIQADVQKSKPAPIVPLDAQRAKNMITYIEEHYFEKITLEELASSVNISRSECCRCFKRVLNLSPIEYLMKYRIYKAAVFISTNDPLAASFSELAYNVGFNNASYFNKVFRQYLNCTPGEYKKMSIDDPASSDLFMSIKI